VARFVTEKPQLISNKQHGRGGLSEEGNGKTMKLPLPPDVEFHEDICLLIHRPRGLLNRAALNKIISLIGELEFTLKKPFNRFLDTVAADAVDLNLEFIRSVSLYRRRFYGNRPAIKTAILATDSTVADYGRLHASLTQGSPINVRVFQNRKEVAQWLGVPLELLAAKPIIDDLSV
jgi:hypothetical protein